MALGWSNAWMGAGAVLWLMPVLERRAVVHMFDMVHTSAHIKDRRERDWASGLAVTH